MGLKISVVIPVYNASKTIVSTVNSVLNQSYKVSEIILINDGSIDDSSRIIRDVFKGYLEENFIVLIDKENEGPSKARNIGVEIAKNEWIAFLDSDDQWIFNKTEEQVRLIERNDKIKICGTSSNIFDCNKKEPFFFITFKQLLFKNYFCTSSVLISKKVFVISKGFDIAQKYSEDYGLWLEILAKKNYGVILNKRLLKYNNDGGERLSNNSFLMTKGELVNYRKQFRKKRIGFVFLNLLIVLSFLKFLKRIK
jgi:glycosyltransferase involved in cell wall biosynthesis